MLFENLREELMFYDGAFRAIMIVKQPMSEEFRIVFQNALDSIAYILKNQNSWLDDQYVSMGFQNIENAKDLLMYLVNEGDFSEEQCLINARTTIGKTKGLHPMPSTLLAKEQREKMEQLRAFARKAIEEHNAKKMPRSEMTGPLRHMVHGATPRKPPSTIANQRALRKERTIGWTFGDSKSPISDDDEHSESRENHMRSPYRGHGR